MQVALSHLNHKGCVASAKSKKKKKSVVFGFLNLSGPLLGFITGTSPHAFVFEG